MPGCGPSDVEERRPESDLPPSDSVVDGELCVVEAGRAVDDIAAVASMTAMSPRLTGASSESSPAGSR
jgi:hypothetical protein